VRARVCVCFRASLKRETVGNYPLRGVNQRFLHLPLWLRGRENPTRYVRGVLSTEGRGEKIYSNSLQKGGRGADQALICHVWRALRCWRLLLLFGNGFLFAGFGN